MKTNKLVQLLWHVAFIITVLILLYPILFAIANSFKTNAAAFANILSLFPVEPVVDNYLALFDKIPLVHIITNTFTVAVIITMVKLITAFCAAYALVFIPVRGSKLFYFLFLLSMFVPFTATMIPNYLTVSAMNLNDTLMGVILPQLVTGSGIFLLHQTMKTIPIAIIDAVKLDDVGHFKIMKDIVLPLLKPQIISTGIWLFIGAWNEYVWPQLILKTKENYTLPLALQLFVSEEGGSNFALVMAMSVVTMIIPLLLYLIFQRQIIGTFTSSGIK